MKIEYNLDIEPKPKTIALFSEIQDLFEEHPLRLEFARRESAATNYKIKYKILTAFALSLIAMSVLAAIGFWLFVDVYPNLAFWANIVGCLGIVGIAFEIFIILRRYKEKWLLNRYAAERLRSHIAQLYAFGASSRSVTSLIKQTEDYSARTLVELGAELNKGSAAFVRFRPRSAIKLPVALDVPGERVFSACKEAYSFLRVDYQKNFVSAEISNTARSQRIENSTSDITFLLGALFAILSLVIVALGESAYISKLLVLIGAFLFCVSSILFLTGLGNSSSIKINRYQNYLDHIEAIEDMPNQKPDDFLQQVHAMEMEALRELEAFCLQVDSVSVRI